MADGPNTEIPQATSKKDNSVSVPVNEGQRGYSLFGEMAEFLRGKPSLEGPYVTEHVSRMTVEGLVEKIGVAYDVPQEAMESGRKTEIYVIENKEFTEFAEEMRMMTIWDQIEKREYTEEEKKIIRQIVRKEVESQDGCHLASKAGRQVVLAKENGKNSEESIESHELIHAMTEGFSSKAFGNVNMNEAATEILSLGVQYPNIATASELYQKVKSGEVHSGYSDIVEPMLLVLMRTETNGTPFTIKDLAKYYFDNAKNDISPLELMKDEIVSKTRPELQENTRNLLNNDLKAPAAMA